MWPVHSGRMRTTETTISSPSSHAALAETQTPKGGRPTTTIVPGERLVLTVAEAGELLGISRAFAYELVARGELPVIRLGRRIVVPKAALLAMVDLTPQIS
jgi:excisionase family DNA binding protein